MKIIIIILQAILNLVRKRRDLIANRSNINIPPEYRDDVVVWYSPTVTGYASYNPCACPATTTTPTTAA